MSPWVFISNNERVEERPISNESQSPEDPQLSEVPPPVYTFVIPENVVQEDSPDGIPHSLPSPPPYPAVSELPKYEEITTENR